MTLLRRLVALALLVLSVWTGGRLVWDVLHEPLWQPFVAAGAQEIRAAIDRQLAQSATPDLLADKISVRLDEVPRNWVALDGLRTLANERGLVLPLPLLDRFDLLKSGDEGWLSEGQACALCAWDAAQCPLSGVLICQAVVAMTPLPDVAGLVRASKAMILGDEVDRLDLGLSVVGLTATGLTIVTGGSSETVKAGAAVLRTARGMGRLSLRFSEWMGRIAARAIDFGALREAKGIDDLVRAVRVTEMSPLIEAAGHVEDLREATDLGTLFHLLPLVEDGEDAAGLARASKAVGKDVVGAAEVLGKGRLLRATLRWSGQAIRLFAGALVLVAAAAHLVGHVLLWAARRSLRRSLRVVLR